jgi:hypothetical protein
MEYFANKWNVEDKPVEGDQPYSLPMMTCPECGNHRGNTSVHYPWLDLAKIFDAGTAKRLRHGRACVRGTDPTEFSWQEFQELRVKIRQQLDKDIPLPPTATFGTFVGKVYATPPATDFVMTVSTNLLARRHVVEELNKQGFGIRYFEVRLKQQKGKEEDYVQIWPAPAGFTGPSSGSKFCPHCERGHGREKFIIKKPDPALDLHVFLLRDQDSSIIFSERIVEAIKQLGFSGLNFEPVPSE